MKVILFLKKLASKLKFENLRVYTDSNSNHYACKLYDKFFEQKEIYLNGNTFSLQDKAFYVADARRNKEGIFDTFWRI